MVPATCTVKRPRVGASSSIPGTLLLLCSRHWARSSKVQVCEPELGSCQSFWVSRGCSSQEAACSSSTAWYSCSKLNRRQAVSSEEADVAMSVFQHLQNVLACTKQTNPSDHSISQCRRPCHAAPIGGMEAVGDGAFQRQGKSFTHCPKISMC